MAYRNKLKGVVKQPVLLAAIMLMVFIIEVILPGNFAWLGIRPRSMSGLIGILFSPFLHANLGHFLSNIVPILIMGSFVSALEPSKFGSRTGVLIVLSGALTWLLSSSGVVIGASGLVFAYWSFLITNGFLRKQVKDVAIALITFIIYGAMIFALFRFQYGISWAGHFSGAIVGVLYAFTQRR